MADRDKKEIVRHLIAEMERLLPLPGRGVFRILKKLEKEALAEQDDALAGYSCFYFANAHFSRNERTQAHAYMRRATRYLMRSGDSELLARTFNLFALDAQFTGCYDIAQNFFQMAYSMVKGNKNSLVRAILDANIGNLMTETGDYATACRRIRRALPIVRRHSEDALSDQNIAVGHLNLGLNSLYLGRHADAKHALEQAETILSGTEVEETIQLTLLLLRAHYAFVMRDFAATGAHVEEIAARIRSGPLYSDFIYDLYNFCRRLLREHGSSYADILISAILESDSSGASEYRRLLLAELTVEFFSERNAQKDLRESLARQHILSRQHQEAQKQMYLYSVELLLQISELREEQEQIRRENELLRHRAEIDPLTGLPNRYALNHTLEEMFSRTLDGERFLAVSIIDIDAFKQYNDLYGHAQGDQCLRLVAEALQRIAAAHGIFVARYGGDEFVLICEDRTDKELSQIASEIRRQMPVRVSLGTFRAIPEENSRPFDFLARADAAMYKEKRGRA